MGPSYSTITMMLTFLILSVPTIILNATLAKRKGKSRALFAWLSVIPYVGFFLMFYLISLPDKEIIEKIDKILSLLEKK